MSASVRVFSLNFEGDKLSPWPFFLRDNFNCGVGLAQWRGPAQTLPELGGPLNIVWLL